MTKIELLKKITQKANRCTSKNRCFYIGNSKFVFPKNEFTLLSPDDHNRSNSGVEQIVRCIDVGNYDVYVRLKYKYGHENNYYMDNVIGIHRFSKSALETIYKNM